jgi:hypothetical protein
MFSIFGFASLFTVLSRYGIYKSRCKIHLDEQFFNQTMTITTHCRAQIDQYQVRLSFH